jgi:lactoylglutathione lyase
MKYGYTIIYVPDVSASLAFFEKAFGFTKRFFDELGYYGELSTGETTLAFASHSIGEMNLPGGYIEASSSQKPLGVEIALITLSVDEAHAKAVEAGATEIKAPEKRPWGQVVSYLRCPDGTLVELCTPVGS